MSSSLLSSYLSLSCVSSFFFPPSAVIAATVEFHKPLSGRFEHNTQITQRRNQQAAEKGESCLIKKCKKKKSVNIDSN